MLLGVLEGDETFITGLSVEKWFTLIKPIGCRGLPGKTEVKNVSPLFGLILLLKKVSIVFVRKAHFLVFSSRASNFDGLKFLRLMIFLSSLNEKKYIGFCSGTNHNQNKGDYSYEFAFNL